MKCPLIVLCSILLLFSCSENDGPFTNGPIASDKWKIASESVIPFAEKETKYFTHYEYENDLLVKLIEITPNYTDTIYYEYNEQNQLILQLKNQDNIQPLDTHFTYEYNSDGTLARIRQYMKDSIPYEYNYYYDDGELVSSKIVSRNGTIISSRMIMDAAGNLSEVRRLETNGVAAADNEWSSFIFDDGINPMQGMFKEGFSLVDYLSNNNVIQINHYADTIINGPIKHMIDYNVFGYPIRIRSELNGLYSERAITYIR